MRFFKLVLVLLFVFTFFYPHESTEAGSCLAFNGKVYIENGGSAKAKLSCAGDEPVGPSNCRGTIDSGPREYSDGQSYNLPNCSCLTDNCLKVQPPPGCTIMEGSKYCGLNGDTKTGDIRIKCAPTPTPPLREVCGGPYCDNHLGDCAPGYKKESIECKYYDSNDNLVSTKYTSKCAESELCKIPTSTPTPSPVPTTPPNAPTATPVPTSPPGVPTATPGPSCNSNCASNPNICQQASGGCTYCNPNNNRCETPPGNPTATRVPTSPPSGPTNTPRPTVPPATPTPDFNPAMCTCDGFDNSALIAGQPATFTAFGKVQGLDTTKAKIKDITFSFAEGNDVTTKRIAKSDPIPAVELPGSTNSLVRYKSSWNYTLPTDLKSGVTYSVWANINCVKATTAFNYDPVQSVAGTSTSTNGGLFGRLMDFINQIFGGPVQQTTQTSQPSSGQAPLNYSPTPNSVASIQNENEKQLQLKTFKPAQIISKSCHIMKFKF